MSANYDQNRTHNGSFAESGATDSCPVCGLRVDNSVTICPRDGTVIGDFSSTEKLLDNRYQVLSLIATGGMGSIYKARQPALNKTVAIKMLKVQNRGDGAWARFQQEAKAASQLEHPNIIRVYDFGETADGQPFMVMDFVEGSNLQTLLKEEKTLPIEEALNIFRQICAGMTLAHSKKVYHRDLKPGNIMLSGLESANPQVRIVDFGIAKVMDGTEDLQALTQTGEVFGSPLYMSPEQALGKKVDGRSDIYSLGCIMHETLTGSLPLVGATPFETLIKHMNEKAPTIRQAKRDGKFSDELVALVAKTLSKDPAKRYQTMEELQDALDTVPEALDLARKRLTTAGRTTGAQSKLQPSLAKTLKMERQELFKPARTISSARSFLLGMLVVVLIGLIVVGYFAATNWISKPAQTPAPVVPIGLSNQEVAATKMAQDQMHYIDEAKPKVDSEEDTEEPSTIYLNGAQYDDTDLAREVSKNPTAMRAIIDRAQISNEGIQVLQNLPLDELSLQRVDISDDGLKILKNFSHLKKLSLANCSGITDKGMVNLSALKHLQALDLSADSEVTDKGLLNLPDSLEMLFLRGDPISSKGCEEIAKLTKLNTLDLSDTSIVNDDLKLLQKLTHLESLSLSGTGISDSGMKYVAKLSRLEHIILARTRITKRGLYELAHLQKLRLLNIDQCPFVHIADVDNLINDSKHTIILDRRETPHAHH